MSLIDVVQAAKGRWTVWVGDQVIGLVGVGLRLAVAMGTATIIGRRSLIITHLFICLFSPIRFPGAGAEGEVGDT